MVNSISGRNAGVGSSDNRKNLQCKFFSSERDECRNETMKKIVVKKRHSIRKSQAQDLLSRLFEQIGNSAKFFHTDMIEVT